MVKDGTEEGGELGIAFASAGDGVDGSLRIGMLATSVGELGLVAGTVVGEEGAGFIKGVEIGDVVEVAAELLLFEELRLFVCRGFVKSGDKEDLRGTTAGFAPTVEVGEFGTLERILFVVARVLDGVGFLYALMDDPTAFVAVLLLTVDDAFAFECAVEFGDGGFEYYKCHII